MLYLQSRGLRAAQTAPAWPISVGASGAGPEPNAVRPYKVVNKSPLNWNIRHVVRRLVNEV